MKLVLAIVVCVVAGCGRDPERLSERFALIARLEPSRPAARAGELEHAVEAIDERDEATVAHAIDKTLDAYEALEVLEPRCDLRVIPWHTLGEAMIDRAPAGDPAQLEAAMWLGHLIYDGYPTMLGAMVGLDLMASAAERLKATRLSPTLAMRELLPPEDFLQEVFAREVLCIDRHLKEDVGAAAERPAIIEHAERTLDRLLAAGPSERAQLKVLKAAAEEAQASDNPVVKMVFGMGGVWDDLVKRRRAIDDYVAAYRPSDDDPAVIALDQRSDVHAPDPAPAVIPEPVRVFVKARFADATKLRGELEASGATFNYDPQTEGYVIGSVRAGTLVDDLGLRDGDILRIIGDDLARDAARAGQGGIGYLVDGLVGDDVLAMVARGDGHALLRWQLQ